MIRRAEALICLIMIITVCLASCGGQKRESRPDENVSVIKSEDDLAFDITFDEFIKTWNRICTDDTRVPGRDDWESYATDRAIHYRSPANNYLYAPGDNDALYPMLHIYTSEKDDKVVQIELSYDDHSMQEHTYNIYEEMCVDSLKCIMQAEDISDLSGVCSRVNTEGSEYVVGQDQEYGEDAVPPQLFHMDGVGLYLYYEIGSRMHFCIIPIDQKSLSEFQEAGTVVERIEPF
jgi:hypothetical protein